MVGKMQKSSLGGYVFLLVAVDKFTKWIEATPITNQIGATTVKFFQSIVYRFVVPCNIITNNGMNFTSKEFQDFYDSLGTNITYATVTHPQNNGQVEEDNDLVCNRI